MQTLIVAMLVVACIVYTSWTLMPAAARRALARMLLKLAPPEALAAKLRRAAAASAGCGCDGCDHAPAKAAPAAAPQVVTFHRRARD
jgi:hypothetical protein